MKFPAGKLLLSALAAAQVWVGGAFAQGAEDVLAKFGATEIRSSDLRRILLAQDAAAREQLLRSPAELDRLVRTEAFKRALLAEARAKGWEKRPEVAAELERVREQALVQSYINSLARPPADFPGEAELRKTYDSAKNELARPREWRVAQIFVAVATPDGEKKAADLGRRAKAPGADFAALARQGSEHAESAARGGEIGWVADGQTLPEVARALSAMKVGETSDPVRSSAGWHVLRVLEVKPAAPREFAEVREYLAALLRARRAQENEAKYFDDMLARNPIAVNEVALIKVRDELAKTR
jgi:parvulin-like peptidyl-prolyl isomerase